MLGTVLLSLLWPEFPVKGNKSVPTTAYSPKYRAEQFILAYSNFQCKSGCAYVSSLVLPI